MQKTDIETLVSKTGSVYKLVIMTSIRAIELSEGAAALVDAKPDGKYINTALREIGAGKISYKVKDAQ